MSLMQEALSNCENKLANGEFPVDEVQLYYEVKKKLATGCEPALVANVVRKLKRLVYQNSPLNTILAKIYAMPLGLPEQGVVDFCICG